MSKPFEKVRILDFSQVVSGPFATSLLCLMGAEVIKFERPPGGDESRTFCASRELLERGMGSAFLALNAGKQSLSLDLKNAEAVAIVKQLIATADVIIENYRPGVMARLGLGYEAVKAIKPDIIYCSISGYGQEGPDRDAPAYDGAVQAAAGVMSITGYPEHEPVRVGFPFADASTGQAAALAIAGALYRKLATGKGQYIDIAMTDATLAMMTQIVAFTSVAGVVPGRIGNLAWSRRPTSDMFRASDQSLCLVVNSEAHYVKLFKALGREDVLSDPRFSDWEARSRNVTDLRAIIEGAFATDTAANWEARLRAAGVAAARVKDIGQALASPQLQTRNLLLTVPGPKGLDRPVTIMNAPFLCDEDGPGTDQPAPNIGEHNEAVLRGLGYSEEEIGAARGSGVFWEPPRRPGAAG